MELLFLLGIGAAAGVGLLLIDNDSSDPVTPDGTEPEEPVGAFQIQDDGSVVGTDGNDSLGLSDLTDGATDLRVSAGGGDDLIDLSDPSASGDLTASPIVADEIDGGDGNDTIVANVLDAQISGGDGDDQIRVRSADTNGLIVDGGAGDDLIDGLAVEDGRLLGGEGNDTITARGHGLPDGTGYVVQPDGGPGSDTIFYDAASGFAVVEPLAPQVAYGGEGADQFNVQVDEGALTYVDGDVEWSIREIYWEVQGERYAPDELTENVLTIPDFEPGVDKLSLEIGTLNDTYDLTSVVLENLATEGMSRVILTYYSDDEPTRIVHVDLGSADVSWDDIELTGDTPEPTATLGTGFDLFGADSVVGSSGDDSVRLSDLRDAGYNRSDASGSNDLYAEFHAHAGNDLIDLSDPNEKWLSNSPYVASEIHGGAGNDTIVASLDILCINGGDGDDHIEIALFAAGGGRVDGGAGDDYINGRSVDNGELLGGEGNDTIIASGFGGTYQEGYVSQPDGGVGDDLIIYHIESDFSDWGFDGMSANGGAGADRFEVHVNEGEMQEPKDPEENINSHLTIVDPNTWQLDTLVIEDFEPGVDTLSLEVGTLNDTYELTSVELESLEAEGMSRVMLTYHSDVAPTRIVNISLGAAGVSWDDIELAGSATDLGVSLGEQG